MFTYEVESCDTEQITVSNPFMIFREDSNGLRIIDGDVLIRLTGLTLDSATIERLIHDVGSDAEEDSDDAGGSDSDSDSDGSNHSCYAYCEGCDACFGGDVDYFDDIDPSDPNALEIYMERSKGRSFDQRVAWIRMMGLTVNAAIVERLIEEDDSDDE